MKTTEKKEFVTVLTAMSLYYGKALDHPILFDFWWGDLKDYPLGDIIRAFEKHRRNEINGQFMPKTCEIIKHIKQSRKKSDNQLLINQSMLGEFEKVRAILKKGNVTQEGKDKALMDVQFLALEHQERNQYIGDDYRETFKVLTEFGAKKNEFLAKRQSQAGKLKKKELTAPQSRRAKKYLNKVLSMRRT